MTGFTIEEAQLGVGLKLVSNEHFQPGEIVAWMTQGRMTGTRSRTSVQISQTRHIEDIGFLQYLNHSCDPSLFVDTVGLVCIALRTIYPGDELTFFYPSTEWEMAEPFACQCGSAGCIGHVAGAERLSRHILTMYRLNLHIADMLLAHSPCQI